MRTALPALTWAAAPSSRATLARMNFEKCGFCRKRIAKTARLDAIYCSPACRMNALRVRNREKRLAERAAAKVKDGCGTDGKAKMAALKAAYLVRVQGARLAAGLPNLPEDPWLATQAEIAACDRMIDALQEKKKILMEQVGKLSPPDDSFRTRPLEIKAAASLNFPRKVLRIGVGVLHGDLEGDAIVYVTEEAEKGKGGRSMYHVRYNPGTRE